MLNYAPDEPDFEQLATILECLQARLATAPQKIITPRLWEDAVKETTATVVAGSEKVVNVAPKNTKQLNLRDSLENHKKEEGIAKDEHVVHTSNEVELYKSKQAEWKIVDAFDTPKLIYDSLRQQFFWPTNRRAAPFVRDCGRQN